MCCDSLFSNNDKVNNINRIDFEKLLRAALQSNFFNFKGKIYRQIDGVTMGSPAGPTLASAFLCFHEQIWLNECRDEFKPAYYRRCVDDIFVLFRSPDHLEKFKNYLNSKHRNIRFTCEKEHSNSMPFLDVLITRTSNDFKTSVYRKPTFSGVYLNFNSFISEEYKVGLIFTLSFRTFSAVSDFSGFHSEVCNLKEILKKNAFPIKLIDSCVKNFLNKRLTEKPVTLTAERKDLVIVLPFYGRLSLDLRTRLRHSISKNLPFCKIRVIFKSSTCISNFFQFKQKISYCLRSNVVYKFSCGRRNATYYGETCWYLSLRVGKHSGVSSLTGNKSKSKKFTVVKDHMFFCDHIVSIDDPNILATSDSVFHVKVKENLLISRDEPILNKNETSLPLYLFD